MVRLVGQSFFRSSQLRAVSKNRPFWRLMQDRHSSRTDSFFPGYTLFSVGGMAQGGEWSGQLLLEGRLILSRLHLVWCRRNGPGWGVVQAQQSGTVIPRGQTHSLQVTLCLVSEEWPRVGNSPGQSFLRVDSFPPGYTVIPDI
jgi:hypothetical protein